MPTPVVRQPVTTIRRGNVPEFSVSIHTVVRKGTGVDLDQILQSFSGKSLSERQRVASQAMGELLVRKAKQYAPKSDSPETGGNMAAGIRLLRINANTVEVVAPPPALWRILGFEATGGLRPWLAKSSARYRTILMATKDATAIHERLVGAMREDYRELARAHGIVTARHQEERKKIVAERNEIVQNIREIQMRYNASLHPMTPQEAESRRSELHAQARSLLGEAEIVSNRAHGMQERSVPHPVTGVARVTLTPERQARIEALHASSSEMSRRAEEIRSRAGQVRVGTIVRHPAVVEEALVRVPELRARHEEVSSRLLANERAAPRPLEELGARDVRDRHGNPVGEVFRGSHYNAEVRKLKSIIGQTEGRLTQSGNRTYLRGSVVRVLEYGDNGLRHTTLQKLLEGAFRYPEGVTFLQQATEDAEVRQTFDLISQEMVRVTTGIGVY